MKNAILTCVVIVVAVALGVLIFQHFDVFMALRKLHGR